MLHQKLKDLALGLADSILAAAMRAPLSDFDALTASALTQRAFLEQGIGMRIGAEAALSEMPFDDIDRVFHAPYGSKLLSTAIDKAEKKAARAHKRRERKPKPVAAKKSEAAPTKKSKPPVAAKKSEAAPTKKSKPPVAAKKSEAAPTKKSKPPVAAKKSEAAPTKKSEPAAPATKDTTPVALILKHLPKAPKFLRADKLGPKTGLRFAQMATTMDDLLARGIVVTKSIGHHRGYATK